jgi:hypothetical protein
MQSLLSVQHEMCRRFGASFLPANDGLMVGLSKNFDSEQFPLNGLRHPPEGHTTGCYIWSGEEFFDEDDFFQPVHTLHLVERCPEIMKYLGLGPGWRFSVAPGYEDVWFDGNLLNI